MYTVPEKFRVSPGVPEGFKVTTLGTGTPGQDLRKSAPCTMVQYKDKYFVCDLGGGATNQMLKAGINPPSVVNVMFTHLHIDHAADYPYFLIVGQHDGRKGLNVVGPPKVREFHNATIKNLYGEFIDYTRNVLGIDMSGVDENVIIRPIEDADEFELDGVKVSTMKVPHTIHTLAYKFEAGGQRIVVSGDLLYYEPFIEFAMDSDILVIDAGLAPSSHMAKMNPEFEANITKSHLTITEVAEVARKSRTKKLVLTHLCRGVYIGETIKRVAGIYDGEIVIAFDLLEMFPGITTGY